MSLVGKKLRNIQVLERIGRGGMGVVYLGFDETLERKVALKAIRRGAHLTTEVKTRFLREARVLSQLEHPNICRIYDFLEIENQEILVLEYLEGPTLAKKMKAGLGQKRQLEIAVQLAQALEAAHGADIVHRDLKPENVICRPDGQIKVLDFGLARPLNPPELDSELAQEGAAQNGSLSSATGADLSIDEENEPTEPAGLSPARRPQGYPSALPGRPAQSHPAPLDAGRSHSDWDPGGEANLADDTPFEDEEPDVSWAEMSPSDDPLDETDPGPQEAQGVSQGNSFNQPSGTYVSNVTRVGSVVGTISYMSPEQACGETLTSASDVYSLGIILHEVFTGQAAYEKGITELVKLQRVAEGKTQPLTGIDSELADLVRQMEDPTPAKRPRAIDVRQRLQRYIDRPARRRRRAFGLLLLLFLLGAAIKYTLDLRHERQRALEALAEAERARVEAQQVSRFLVDVFEVADPRNARGRDVTAREILEEGVAKLDDLESQPEAKGRLLSTAGEVYYKLGFYHESRDLLERAMAIQEVFLPDDHPALATTLGRLGEACRFLDDYACARDLQGRALGIHRKLFPEGHPELAASLLRMGQINYDEGRLEDAAAQLEEGVAILRQAEEGAAEILAASLGLLGKCLVDMGDSARAERLLLDSVALYERHVGNDHPSLAIALEDLGFVYHDQARYEEARPAMERCLQIRERVFGPHHQSLAISSSYLASIASAEGQFEEAEALLLRAVNIFSARLGPDHFNVGAALIFLGDNYLAFGRLEEAEEAFQRSLEIAGGLDVEESFNGLAARQGLGEVALAGGDWGRAEKELGACVEPYVSVVGEASTEVVETLLGLGRAIHAQGREEKAKQHLVRAEAAARALVATAPEGPSGLRVHARAQLALGALEEAQSEGAGEARFEDALETLDNLPGADKEVALQALRAEARLRLNRDASDILAKLKKLGWADPALWRLAAGKKSS